jgi:large subunit ribosomal protein L23
MEAHYVIKRPMVTEKGTFAMNEQGRYTFEVHTDADKNDIKAAVEALYKVTQTHRGAYRRLKFGMGQESCTKTAVVRLKKGDAIELF